MLRVKASEGVLLVIRPHTILEGIGMNVLNEICLRMGQDPVALQMIRPTKTQITRLYERHKGKDFLPWLVEGMTSGDVITIVFEGKDVVDKARRIVGETDPAKAEPHSIRAKYSKDSFDDSRAREEMLKNVVHASATKAEASEEIVIFFPGWDTSGYNRIQPE